MNENTPLIFHSAGKEDLIKLYELRIVYLHQISQERVKKMCGENFLKEGAKLIQITMKLGTTAVILDHFLSD